MSPLPNYDEWSRDQLITRLIFLEEKLEVSNAEDIMARLPINLGPKAEAVLITLINNHPEFTSSAELRSQAKIKSDVSLKTIMCYLRTKLATPDGTGPTITTRYGRGYRLDGMEALVELAKRSSSEGLVNDPRTSRITGLRDPVKVEPGNR